MSFNITGKSVQYLDLSVSENGYSGMLKVLTAKQNDTNSRFINFTIHDTKSRINCSPDIIRLNTKLPDGTPIYSLGEVIDGEMYVKLSTDMLEQAGRCVCDISLSGESAVNMSTTSTSISQLNVNENKFKQAYEDDVVLQLKYNNGHWYNGSTQVSMEELGISYLGTPQANDLIDIDYRKEFILTTETFFLLVRETENDESADEGEDEYVPSVIKNIIGKQVIISAELTNTSGTTLDFAVDNATEVSQYITKGREVILDLYYSGSGTLPLNKACYLKFGDTKYLICKSIRTMTAANLAFLNGIYVSDSNYYTGWSTVQTWVTKAIIAKDETHDIWAFAVEQATNEKKLDKNFTNNTKSGYIDWSSVFDGLTMYYGTTDKAVLAKLTDEKFNIDVMSMNQSTSELDTTNISFDKDGVKVNNKILSSKEYVDGEIDALDNAKQDKLTAGTNITITNNTISTLPIDDNPTQNSNNTVKSGGVYNKLKDITDLIPAEANTSNQLADKAFTNSTVATNTAVFRGTYNIVTDLSLTTSATEQQIIAALASKMTSLSITPTPNDYCFVAFPNASVSTQYDKYDRYKYTVSGNQGAWGYEFTLNNSSFTASQWAAITSGITSSLVSQISTNASNITSLQSAMSGKQDKLTAGENITISNNVISSAGTTYTAGENITIEDNVISAVIPESSEAILELQRNKQEKNIIYKNVSVSSWAEDSTYTGFGYKATVTLANADETMIPFVTFSVADSVSGNYAPVAQSFTHGIYIYSKVNTTITLPLVVLMKTNEITTSYVENASGGYTLTITGSNYTEQENSAGGYTLTIGE